jgi:hypothetical protein
LPIKKDFEDKLNDYIFNLLKEYITKTNTVYRGMRFYHYNEFNDFMQELNIKGVAPKKDNKFMPLTLSREVALLFAGGTYGVLLEIDPNGLEILPMKYGKREGENEYIFFRTEAEVKTPHIPLSNIRKIYINPKRSCPLLRWL